MRVRFYICVFFKRRIEHSFLPIYQPGEVKNQSFNHFLFQIKSENPLKICFENLAPSMKYFSVGFCSSAVGSVACGHSPLFKGHLVPFASTRTDPEFVILSEISQRNKYHRISFICGILKKKKQLVQMTLFTKQRHPRRKQTYCYRAKREGGMSREPESDRNTAVYKIDTMRARCAAQGTVQCSAVTRTGRKSKRVDVRTRMTDSFCCP